MEELPNSNNPEKQQAAKNPLEIRNAKKTKVLDTAKAALKKNLPEFHPAAPPDQEEENPWIRKAKIQEKERREAEERAGMDWIEEAIERQKQDVLRSEARKKVEREAEERAGMDWSRLVEEAIERQKSAKDHHGDIAIEKKEITDSSLAKEKREVQDKNRYELYNSRRYPALIDKADYLRRQYGIGVVYGENYEGDRVHIQKSSSQNDAVALDKICRTINLLPREFTKHLENITFVLGSKIVDDEVKWNPSGIQMITPKGPVIALVASSPYIETNFFHEIFHGYDWKFNKDTQDDKGWMYKSGSEYTGENFRNGREFPLGFRRKYGKYNAFEDQATMAEGLFDKININNLFQRAETDIKLRVKLGLMTACLFDVSTGQFSRVMTKEEYRKFSGFQDYKYFYAWSEHHMDHRYWNAIANGRPMKF